MEAFHDSKMFDQCLLFIQDPLLLMDITINVSAQFKCAEKHSSIHDQKVQQYNNCLKYRRTFLYVEENKINIKLFSKITFPQEM